MPLFIPKGYLSLGDAIEAFGRQQFGEAWTGSEVAGCTGGNVNCADRDTKDRFKAACLATWAAFHSGQPQVWLIEVISGELLKIPPARWLSNDIEIDIDKSFIRWRAVVDPTHSLGIVPISGTAVVRRRDIEPSSEEADAQPTANAKPAEIPLSKDTSAQQPRKAGEPKASTIATWKTDHDDIEEAKKTLGQGTSLTDAVDHVVTYDTSGRKKGGLERNHRKYRQHLKRLIGEI